MPDLFISIHAPHAGSGNITSSTEQTTSTISIHAPHAGSGEYDAKIAEIADISIHAPHAGSGFEKIFKRPSMQISIHAPHAGSGNCFKSCYGQRPKFQSTLPMRGAALRLAR